MNKKENELNKLTRTLFKSAAMEPSPDLIRRIMGRIAKEEPLKAGQPKVAHIKSWKISPWILLAGAFYLIATISILLFLKGGQKVDMSVFTSLKDIFPYLLTGCIVVISLPFFKTIDEALS